MVLKRPLQISNGFWGDHHHWMFFGGLTIAINGFSMFFLFCYHRFQWFSMVPDHWLNDAMVSMDRCGLTSTMFKIYFQTGKTAEHYIGCHFVHSGCAVSEKRQLLLCTTVCNLPNDLQRRASAGPQQLSWKPRCTSTTLELVKRRHLAQLGRGLYPLYKIW